MTSLVPPEATLRRPFADGTLKVHPLCLGGNVFGWSIDEPTSFAVLDAYREAGGNFVDTADSYSAWIPGHVGGESETIIGKWMKARGVRHEMIIATKVGSLQGDTPDQKGLKATHIEKAAEASLRRLQVETIDLYYAHKDDEETPLEETVTAFDKLVKAGKVRVLGASNYKPERLTAALDLAEKAGLARFAALQPHYNVVERGGFEGQLAAVCAARGLAVFPYFALARGFVTGKYRRGEAVPEGTRSEAVKSTYMNEHGFAVLDALARVAKRVDATTAEVALAWLMTKTTAPIAGATSPDHVRELTRAARVALSEADVREIANA